MDLHDHTDPSDAEDLPTPVPAKPASKRTALVGAVLGMTALAGTIVGVGAIAGAQDDPASTTEPAAESAGADADSGGSAEGIADVVDADFAPFDECMSEQLGDLWGDPGIPFADVDIDELPFDEGDIVDFFDSGEGEMFFDGELPFDADVDFPEPTPEEIAQWEAEEEQFQAAEEACHDLLPAEVKAEIEAWQPYEACIDEQIGDLADPWAGGTEPSEADWEAHDAAWEAADQACRDLLPADVQEEMAAWDAFDDCLKDAGLFDEDPFGGAVHIETGDGFSIAQFGDTEGSVTISGTAGNLDVVTTGGVTVLDEADLDAQWDAFDEAHAACEELLPEDLRAGMFFEDEIFFEDGVSLEDGEEHGEDE